MSEPYQPFSRGEHVYLRALEANDVPAVVRWFNDPEVTDTLLMGRKPMNEIREREWLGDLYKNDTDVVFGICKVENDSLIGCCGVHAIQWIDRFGTLGVVIGDKTQWGQGYATEAMRLLVRYGFEVLNLRRLELSVFSHNPRAARLYEKLGFIQEGRLVARRLRAGRYVDEVVLALTPESDRRAKVRPSRASGKIRHRS